MIKTRFCPSPTGFMHIGNARTAAFSYLFAKSQAGQFLLRIEDTDTERSKASFTQQIMQDLHWLGLAWDEGAKLGETQGEYFQSERTAIYDKYYQQLLEQKIAYPCFCTPEQLALSRKLQRSRGIAPKYAGTCRNLSSEEIAAKRAQGLAETLRFKVPEAEQISFVDLVKGQQSFASADIGDFIIRKADNMPTFFFCNVVDDALMGVTHVIRGEDHVTNTPRQMLILQALGLALPTYGHIALILGDDGAPLSKRNGSRSIMELKQQGYLATAVMNAMARLGHYYKEEKLLTISKLAENFKVESLSKSPARFDLTHLDHWQSEAVVNLDGQQFWQWVKTHVEAIVPEKQIKQFVQTVKANVLFPEQAKQWATCFYTDKLDYSPEQIEQFQQASKDYFSIATTTLENQGTDYAGIINALKSQLGLKGKALFKPLRLALTARTDGMELDKIIQLLGVERTKLRLQQAATNL
ncbi:MAG: glutamate--tRNA ligase [Pseudomonadota bacterium]